MRMKNWMKKMMMRRSTVIPYVVRVEKTMLQMNSGFVATYARSGFMESV